MNRDLVWKPLSVSHVNLIYDSIDGNVAKYFYNFKTIDEAESWVRKAVSEHMTGNKKEYAIFDREEFIGMISPRFTSSKMVDVGMWVKGKHQGKGYGKKMLEELFIRMKDVCVEKVLYETDVNNVQSIKLASSVGFMKVKESEGEICFVKYL